MSLYENIRKYRTEKGLTQEQLAGKLGVSPQAVSKWETSGTYPDSTLLVPIADALGVSLDVLFDHKVFSMEDISARIRGLISSTENDKSFHLVRDMCWQMEKGLSGFSMEVDGRYDPEEIHTRKFTSYILNDYGFTHVSNGRAPFFSVFPQYGDSFSQVIGDGEEMRKIFEILASPETMKAVLFIHRHKQGWLFEKEVLADACGIEEGKAEEVMKDLMLLRVAEKKDVDIDGERRTLYDAKPSHVLIGLLLFAHELNYRGAYCVQCDQRKTPYLR